MDSIDWQIISLAAESRAFLAFGAALSFILAVLGIYKLGSYLVLVLVRTKYKHSSTTITRDRPDTSSKYFSSPHDSGYASEGSDLDEEDDPELLSLRKAIEMCQYQPPTRCQDREMVFEVFADFARASTGSREEALGLGVHLGEGEESEG